MERLTKRISENLIELSAKANPIQYNGKPQRVHIKHPFWNVFNRLCEYEDAEKQGLLKKLPCKVGDTVWCICYRYGYGSKDIPFACKSYVRQIIFNTRTTAIEVEYSDDIGLYGCSYHVRDIGKTVFLTKEEAEQAVQVLKEGEKNE